MKSITRAALATAASLALLGAIPATASAGEMTGSGKPTPVAGHIAASLCSFSGLEDHPVDPGTVQNWGILGPEGRAFLLSLTPLFQPGNSCNPNGEPLPEE